VNPDEYATQLMCQSLGRLEDALDLIYTEMQDQGDFTIAEVMGIFSALLIPLMDVAEHLIKVHLGDEPMICDL
jgi:hypothetical protein